MRLTQVSVWKYRSIDKKSDFKVENFTVLVGPNNQGKSNLLRATVLAMQVIEEWADLPDSVRAGREIPLRAILPNRGRARMRGRSTSNTVGYRWDEDFPVFAQERQGSQKSTVIHLDFELSPHEQGDFRDETGISINQRLPVEVSLNQRTVKLSIPKQGKGRHKEKAREIARFITNRIALLHIPAVRTVETALQITEQILSLRRRQLQKSAEYAEAMNQVERLEQSAVTEVESILNSTLSQFLPGIDTVRLETRSYSSVSSVDNILVDDGVLTSISSKGDGIQSLIALALTMEWTQSNNHPDKQLIIAVEEPESHLHPGAVHEIRRVLQTIAETQQVVVTTHSQALVNRHSLSQNVIVSGRSAKPAKKLDDLRDALGVRLSDALSAAEVVIVCEGSYDEKLLPALLTQRDSRISEWLRDGRLLIESAGSGTKIYPRVLAARSILTAPLVLLDGDPAGKKDAARLIEDGVIEATSIVQIFRPECKNSELEDLLVQDSYIDALEERIGYPLSPRDRRILDKGREEAWSERLEKILERAGFPSPASLVKPCKHVVVEAALKSIDSGSEVIRPGCEDQFDRLTSLVCSNLQSN